MADFQRHEELEFRGMPAIRWRSRDGACAVEPPVVLQPGAEWSGGQVLVTSGAGA
jgi:hypothetical protein